MQQDNHNSSKSVKQILLWFCLVVSLGTCAAVLLPKLFGPAINSSNNAPPSIHQGCIDRRGKVVVRPVFDSIHAFDSNLTNVIFKGVPRFIDKNGDFIGGENYQAVAPFAEGMASVCENGKWGFLDERGRLAIPLRYESADSFSEGLARVSLAGKNMFIDKSGAQIFSLSSTDIASGPFRNGLVAATTQSGWTFVDASGSKHLRTDIEDIYPRIDQKSQKLLAVLMKPEPALSSSFPSRQKWGVVNDQGEFVVEPMYSEIPSIISAKERILLVGENFAALTDLKGRELARFDSAFPVLFNTAAIVKSKGKWGLVDLTGKFVVPAQYDEIRRLKGGLFVLRRGTTWSAVNEMTGQDQFSPPLKGAHLVEKLISDEEKDANLRPINLGEKWGAADAKSGQIVVACEYDRPVGFGKDGLCSNSRNGKPVLFDRKGRELSTERVALAGGGQVVFQKSLCGFLDRSGMWKIPASFDEASSFANGFAAFRTGAKWGVVDINGRIVCPPKFDSVGSYSKDGMVPFRRGALWGFMNEKGEVVIAAKYAQVRGFSDNLAAVQDPQSGWGFINKVGEVIVPLTYFGVTDFSSSRAIVWRIKKNKSPKPFDFNVIDETAKLVGGPFAYALESGSGTVSVTEDFLNWTLLDKDCHPICKFKHFAEPGVFKTDETLPMVNDRMVISMPEAQRE